MHKDISGALPISIPCMFKVSSLYRYVKTTTHPLPPFHCLLIKLRSHYDRTYKSPTPYTSLRCHRTLTLRRGPLMQARQVGKTIHQQKRYTSVHTPRASMPMGNLLVTFTCYTFLQKYHRYEEFLRVWGHLSHPPPLEERFPFPCKEMQSDSKL